MGRIFNAVVDYLTEDDWKYTVLDGENALMLSFRGKSGSWQCFGRADEEKECFSFYSVLPPHAGEDRRAVVAEFINRANYGLIVGNFEMDYRDGQVRYKTSIDIEGGELTPKMIENIVYANLMTMDDYFPGFMDVMYGDKEPAQAIEEIESKSGYEHSVGEDEEEDEHEGFSTDTGTD
ncbi:MAG TPA: YbjN domain-containing protein [Gemmataceae bacterium]|nr:YbjN domain-containing protein [Gemmataceae bacterium]